MAPPRRRGHLSSLFTGDPHPRQTWKGMTLGALIEEWRGLSALFVLERDGIETEYAGILDGPYVGESPAVGFVLGERLLSGDLAVGGAYVDISPREARSAAHVGAGYVELNVRDMPTEIEKHRQRGPLDARPGRRLSPGVPPGGDGCLGAPDYFKNPSDERLAEVSRAWLRYVSKDREKPDPDDPDWWAGQLVMGLHGDLETEWRLVLGLCSLADNEKVAGDDRRRPDRGPARQLRRASDGRDRIREGSESGPAPSNGFCMGILESRKAEVRGTPRPARNCAGRRRRGEHAAP